jgi:hypothetical protein
MIRNILALVLGVSSGFAAIPLSVYLGTFSWGFWAFYVLTNVVVPVTICLVARSRTVILTAVPGLIVWTITLVRYPWMLDTIGGVVGTLLYFVLSTGLPVCIGVIFAIRKGNLEKGLLR